MAEVGILNLEIRDNSYEAGTHLASLAGVLRTIKEVAPGNELGSVARALKKINESINTKTPGVLNGIGRALEKIKAASNFELPNLQGLKSVMKYMQSLEKSAGGLSDATRQAMAGMGEQTETVRGSLDTLGSSIAQVTEQFRDMQSAMNDGSQSNIGLIFSGFDPSMIQLDAFRMTMEQFRQGAQEMTQLGDMVRNSFESIRDTITSGFTQGMNETREIFRLTMDDISGYTEQTANKIIGSLDGMYEKFRFILNEWLSMRSSMTLGDGKEGFAALGPGMELSTNVEKGWAEWKDGAIEVEGTVRDATEGINGYIEGNVVRLHTAAENIESLKQRIEELEARSAAFKAEIENEIVGGNGTITWQEAKTAAQAIDELDERIRQMKEDLRAAIEENAANAKERIHDVAGDFDASEKRRKQEEHFYAEPTQKSMEETNAMADNLTQLDLLKAKLRDAEIEYNKFVNELGENATKTIKAGLAVSDLRDKIWAYKESLEKTTESVSVNGADRVAEMLNASEIELLKQEYNSRKAVLEQAVESGKISEQQALREASALQKLHDKITALTDAEEDQKSMTDRLNDAWSNLKDGMARMFPTITGLLNRFKSIVKYRMLRAVIKHISDGFKEGVENVYFYSKAIGSSFHKQMDAAAASLLQMKNAIGAAVAPAIQAFIPLLQSLVNWFINLVNIANQFFALLTGQKTWTRAILATTSAYDDQTKAAKKAGAAVKDLLADWDELNIIQSNTAGGSGSGSGKVAEDYLKMFEEVGKFDNEIKKVTDFVKNALAFIEEHMGGIWDLIKLIGIGILGWKISSAFEGWLGKIGSLIGGVVSLTIGMELSYGAGFEAGKKGFFSSSDLLTAVGGAIASGIGGWFLLGPTGLILGVGASLFVTIMGYIAGSKDREDMLKWGETSLTPEEIEAYVQSKFEFNINPKIEILESSINVSQTSRAKLEEKIARFSSSLRQIHLSAKISPDAIIQAETDAQDMITEINTFIKDNEKNIETTLKVLPLSTEEDKNILSSVKIADTTLQAYMSDLGKEMAKWMDEGQRSGWKNGEDEMVLELMERQRNIVERSKQGEMLSGFAADSAINLANMTRDNAQEVLARQNELLSQFRMDAEQAIKEEAMNLSILANIAENAAIDAEQRGLKQKAKDLRQSAQDYKDAVAKLLDPVNIAARINGQVGEAEELMRSEWVEALKAVYGSDIDFGSFGMTNIFREWLGMDDYTTADIKESLKNGGPSAAGKVIQSYIAGMFTDSIDPNGIITDAMQTFGFTYFDLLPDLFKKQLAQKLSGVFGEGLAKNILEYAGLSGEEIEKLFAMEMEGIDISQAIIDSMEDNNWRELSDDEFYELIHRLYAIFGSEKVQEVLSEAFDIPAADYVEKVNEVKETVEDVADVYAELSKVLEKFGLHAGNGGSGIFRQMMYSMLPKTNDVETLRKALDEGLRKAIINENADLAGVMDELGTSAWGMMSEEMRYNIQQMLLDWYDKDTVTKLMDAMRTEIPDADNGIEAKPIKIDKFAGSLDDMVEKTKATVKTIKEMLASLNSSASITTDVRVGGGRWWGRSDEVQMRANGGPIRSGDLIMANENGQIEMMGKMGRDPVVANNQQIVDGITSGVTNANDNVVSELRNLLAVTQRILNKKFSAQVIAGSGLGRANQMSADAYGRVTG